MKFPYASLAALCSVLAASCAPPLLTQEMREEIASGNVTKAKLYVDESGRVSKHALYVTRAAVPDWVPAYADKAIGKGSNEYFELEWYADQPKVKVYECTRTINGKKVEVSVNEYQQLRYIEREIAPSALPAGVMKAVAQLKGFKVTEAEQKKGPAMHIYEVEGRAGGEEYSYIFDASGNQIAKRASAKAEIELNLD